MLQRLRITTVLISTFIVTTVSSSLSSAQTPVPGNMFRPQATPQQPAFQQPAVQFPVATASPATANSEVTTVVAAGDKNLFATLETSKGTIKVELFATITPRTVRNFVELANGQKDFTDVKSGRAERRPFYDGLIFHKVTKGFLIQTGCPYGNGKGGPGYVFNDELTPSLRHDKAGVVSMANTSANGNGSQFFITLEARPELDDKFTVFGQVIDGIDVVRKIASVKVGPTDRPLKRIYLKKVTISE